VAAQRHDAGPRPPHVAEQQLQQRAAADHLGPVGVLGPGHGVGERRGPIGAGVVQDGLGHLEEGVARAAGHSLDHLGRVAAEVALDDLEDGPRVLQRLIALRRRLQQRAHQWIERRPGR
jgi:hypothetical protein